MAVKVLALASGVTGLSDHRVLEGVLTQSAGQLAIRSGVAASTGGALSTVSAMVARIAPVKVIINNSIASSLGPYILVSDANVDLTFADGEASVARTDRVIARAYDNTNDGSGDTKGDVYYLKGQASGAATALPNNSVLLYEVLVPAGASAGGGGINFNTATTDKRVYTTALGGIAPVASATDMSAISSAYEGMTIYRTDLDIIYVYDGTNFKPRAQSSVASSGNLTDITNPFNGMLATVRDKNDVYMYNGSSWIWVGTPVRTRVAATVSTSDSAGVGTTETTVRSVTFSAESGFKYAIRYNGSVLSDVAGDYDNVRIREDSSSGTQIKLGQVALPIVTSNGFNVSMYAEWTAASTASKTIVVTIQRSFGTGTAHKVHASATTPDYLTVDRIVS